MEPTEVTTVEFWEQGFTKCETVESLCKHSWNTLGGYFVPAGLSRRLELQIKIVTLYINVRKAEDEFMYAGERT
jgi:hypothetical protein